MTQPATGALQQFIRTETERILDACTQCGKCVEACPMTPYSPAMAGSDAGAVASGILALLRGEQGTPAALGWTTVCVHTGACTPACPEKVDAKMMVRIAHMQACGGLRGPAQVPVRQDRDFFDRVRAFGRLALSDEELKDWT